MRAPDPGTGQAVDLGCICPVTDNCNGSGYRGGNGLRWGEGGQFVVRSDCPIHQDHRHDVAEDCPQPPLAIGAKPR